MFPIESRQDYDVVANRLKALNQIIDAALWTKGVALANDMFGYLKADDMEDMGGVDDMLTNFYVTRDKLDRAMREWEAIEASGSPARANAGGAG